MMAKTLLRQFAEFVSQLAVAPLLLIYAIMTFVVDRDDALHSCSQLMSLVPGLTGCYLRSAFYRWVLEDFHPSARVGFGALLSKTGSHIGENVYVGAYCQLGLVTLGRDTLLGPNVQVPSGGMTHGIESLSVPIREQSGRIVRVTIGRDCWIGSQSVILADIGSQSIIGAGSVVTRELPAQVIAVGNPAKVLRTRSNDDREASELTGIDTSSTVPSSDLPHGLRN